MILGYRNSKKRGQEEMVGFGLIIVIVAVILLVFLWFSLNGRDEGVIESNTVESYIQSFLSYTTTCEDTRYGFFDVKDLIFECNKDEICGNDISACDTLNTTLTQITQESFKINENSFISGYLLNIEVDEKNVFRLENGNLTGNSKGSIEILPRRTKIRFILYSKP